MIPSRLRLNRLIVHKDKHVVYDEVFHDGVNIIHSVDNSCGKSSIADFIFFALGGDLKEFKKYAGLCSFVYAEVTLNNVVVTLRRQIVVPSQSVDIFFKDYETSLKASLDQWENFSIIRRTDKKLSFSEVMFKAMGIPLVKGLDNANLTMHQLLRVLYVDQITPVHRIFRLEDFDPPIIREAVGNLLCGIGGYGLIEKYIEQRLLAKEYDILVNELRALTAAANAQKIDIDWNIILDKLSALENERQVLYQKLNVIPEEEIVSATRAVQDARKKLGVELSKLSKLIAELLQDAKTLEYEIEDTESYLTFLRETISSLNETALAAKTLTALKFDYCPACLEPVHPIVDGCYLCKSDASHPETATRLLRIKLDTEMQLRDSLKIQHTRKLDLQSINATVSRLTRQYKTKAIQAESFVSENPLMVNPLTAKIHQDIGYLNNQIEVLGRDLQLANQIKELRDKRDNAELAVKRLESEIEFIERGQQTRKQFVYNLVTKQALEFLRNDTIQEEFRTGLQVDYSFDKDYITLDGVSNFSASSNVILKNSFMLALFVASLVDPQFHLPRFMILDNIEDKGMRRERSADFQRLIISVSKAMTVPHQIIFTTSMIAEELRESDYVVGEEYSKTNRTLKIMPMAGSVFD